MNRTGGERRCRKVNGGRECTRTVCGHFAQNDGAEATVSANRGYTESDDFCAEETCANNVGFGRTGCLELYESC